MDNVTTEATATPAANWTVFVLRNSADLFFVGHTDDLPAFLGTADTNVAKWTGQPGPWPLVWKHEGLTEAAARKYEISLKRDKNTPRFSNASTSRRPRHRLRAKPEGNRPRIVNQIRSE